MSPDTYFLITFWLGLAGVLFAGYLSAVRLITKECAFNEPCPYFLGLPSCWFGFGMFLVMFSAVASARLGYLSGATATNILLWVSLMGILFAGYFTVQELSAWLRARGTRYALILPNCSYGLIFYIAIFILSLAQ